MRVALRRVRWAGGMLLALLIIGTVARIVAVQQTSGRHDISGVVRGETGAEAGVWVIAETDDLETRFRKIVVTDEAGRFLIPDLPGATYQVWVRGYGLVDTDKEQARPGDEVMFEAKAATPQEAARIYPANYWYSLMEVPPASDFPGTGVSGNGISPTMRTQAHWIDRLKDGCQLCHQLGNQATREFPKLDLDDFDSSVAAWDYRVRVGKHGTSMNTALNRMGRRRALEMYADWTDRIKAGQVPPQPPRPQGKERNLVLTMWAWGTEKRQVHDNIATDKRNPRLYPNGPVYGTGEVGFVITDPIAHRSVRLDLKSLVPIQTQGGGETLNRDTIEVRPNDTAIGDALEFPSPYWGQDVEGGLSGHNPMMDDKGRVWITQTIRPTDNPAGCKEGSDHPSARYFPVNRGFKQLSYYDPRTQDFVFVDTCYSTHHLHFAEDADDTLWLSGDTDVVGWLNTKLYDQSGDELASQGWCPTVLDTDGDGKITRPWNEPGESVDPTRDTRLSAFAYGIIPNPVDQSIWTVQWHGYGRNITTDMIDMPSRLVRLELGRNPPETCKAEVYEPPFENDRVDPSQWGYTPRGIDVDRNGVLWTALSGSGHLASFDRRKCKVVNGPTATGQHCPEGWTLYQTPGPRMRGVTGSANADFHYYNWVDQFNTLGLGENVPIANGTGSDSLLALLPTTQEWFVMRVPYPLGFYTRGLNGRIDDPEAGWKGRGLWASYDSMANWHAEDGDEGVNGYIIHFQLRSHPLED